MLKRSAWMMLVFVVSSEWVLAQDSVSISGLKMLTIPRTPSPMVDRGLMSQPSRSLLKPVSVLALRLSDASKHQFAHSIHILAYEMKWPLKTSHHSKAVQLGMNNVPVLNQGEHGSCMTFASTAAIDAALGKGDYVSQLCLLDLNQYLHHRAYLQQGWNGAWGHEIYGQIAMFGIVPKSIQSAGGCLGRIEYPLRYEEMRDELSLSAYHQLSEPIQAYGLSFHPLMASDQINLNLSDRTKILNQIKTIIEQGERVTCTMLLMGQSREDGSPLGTHHVNKDTWVLLPSMAEQILHDQESAGHAFVISGYDDQAIATDQSGQVHRGLLTLRNSWGSRVGDQGDFYVSYNYFKAALLEAHHIKRGLKS